METVKFNDAEDLMKRVNKEVVGTLNKGGIVIVQRDQPHPPELFPNLNPVLFIYPDDTVDNELVKSVNRYLENRGYRPSSLSGLPEALIEVMLTFLCASGAKERYEKHKDTNFFIVESPVNVGGLILAELTDDEIKWVSERKSLREVTEKRMEAKLNGT